MKCGDEILDVMGIDPAGNIDVPSWIAEHQAQFHRFAEVLAAGIPGAEAYSTKKMWRVKKSGRRLRIAELLENLASVRAAFETLRQDLDRDKETFPGT